jgi:hypothetical protein
LQQYSVHNCCFRTANGDSSNYIAAGLAIYRHQKNFMKHNGTMQVRHLPVQVTRIFRVCTSGISALSFCSMFIQKATLNGPKYQLNAAKGKS